MRIVDIKISDTPGPTWFNKLVHGTISIIIWPFAMLFMLLIFITVPAYNFIRTKILKYEAEPPKIVRDVMFDNGLVSILKEPIMYGVDKLAEDFQFSIVTYDDEMGIYKLRTIPEVAGLHDNYVTDFKLDFEDELVLQRIVKENDLVSSQVIGWDKKTSEVKVYGTVGLFGLLEFEKQTSEIIGFNKKETIRIKVERLASA